MRVTLRCQSVKENWNDSLTYKVKESVKKLLTLRIGNAGLKILKWTDTEILDNNILAGYGMNPKMDRNSEKLILETKTFIER